MGFLVKKGSFLNRYKKTTQSVFLQRREENPQFVASCSHDQAYLHFGPFCGPLIEVIGYIYICICICIFVCVMLLRTWRLEGGTASVSMPWMRSAGALLLTWHTLCQGWPYARDARASWIVFSLAVLLPRFGISLAIYTGVKTLSLGNSEKSLKGGASRPRGRHARKKVESKSKTSPKPEKNLKNSHFRLFFEPFFDPRSERRQEPLFRFFSEFSRERPFWLL